MATKKKKKKKGRAPVLVIVLTIILSILLYFNFRGNNIKLSKDDSFSLDKEFTIKLFIKSLHRTDFSEILTLFFSNTSYGNYQENLWISPFLKIISPPPDTSL